ncbi:chitinase [Streptomyces abyssalis]|uniref:Chitinase n=1 Tax=Streptomyces abyssalis TaxID=933944 RepID=A0A1E7JKP1_9ACTN|nr:chitinase [Streptomyces abyssalis]OEU88220.1 chitinase [Streptomyces abyssalis]OEU91091.1 chitinase [Streptomyces abyssalis]
MRNRAEAQPSGGSRTVKPVLTSLAAAAVAASLLAGCSTGQNDPEPTGPPPAKTPPKESEAPAPDAFAPYVDTSLKPSFDLVRSAERTGVKEYNLAFVSPGGGRCVPQWGGRQKLTGNPVAAQADELRDKGGDVRVSFGGQSGNELARACRSVDALAAAYTEVIDAYDLTKLDFDLEGPALKDKKANELRSQAIVRLQRQRPNLNVSFTLPVMPSGLGADSLAVLKNAQKNGARINRVNIMAMDYGTYYDGDMGKYAVKAATAAHRQIQPALGIEDEEEAWDSLAVTPMIGVNDVKGEIFRPGDAAELKKFADSKELGGLSMWSATRDRPCPGGADSRAQATCSGIGEKTDVFTEAFTD